MQTMCSNVLCYRHTTSAEAKRDRMRYIPKGVSEKLLSAAAGNENK